ncbi:hypothetical protein [Serratia marcescens]|uniref:hypothetical protein n=1 Tax=Serratia marcescens TaxID=615 RepID=UPI003D040FA2
MAKPDWGELQLQFLSDRSKTGISLEDWCKAQGLNYNTARRHIKSTAQIAQKTAQRKTRTAQNKKTNRPHRERNGGENCAEKKCANGSDTKRAHYNARPGNQNALKHGGYGRRMLYSDEISEDARDLALDDELFRLRAANLTAAENIGRLITRLEDATDEQRKVLKDEITAADKAMMRNTVRIESLEHTKASIRKLNADTEYRIVVTGKVEMEIDIMKDGDSDNAIVVHNTLPIPGR